MAVGPVAIGLDLGTTNTKVVVAGVAGPLVVLGCPTSRDADGMLRGTLALIAEAVARAGFRPEAVGIASMAESGFGLDAVKRAVTPLLSWQDARSDAALRAWVAGVGPDHYFAATGVRPGPKPPLALWLDRRARPAGSSDGWTDWSGVADLLHHALTGVLRTDHTLAGRTGAYLLPDAGAPPADHFDADLLAAAGLAPERLPRVGLPGEPPDVVTRDAAAATGLAAGTPVVVAGHDHQVAAWAAGVRSPGTVADSVGTAEAVLAPVDRVADRAALGRDGFSLTRGVDAATEVVVGGSPAAGAFLQWVADRESGGDVGALLEAAFADRDVLAGDAFWLPYPRGRQCPHPAPDATARLVGTPSAPPGVLAVEAVCYQAQWLVEAALAHAGQAASGALVVIGEAVRRSAPWQGVKAGLADRPARLVDVGEPVACGAALLALARAGCAPGDATLPSTPLIGEPAATAAYRARLRAFVSAATEGDP